MSNFKNTPKVPNHRGLGKKLKRALPRRLFSAFRFAFNKSLSLVPFSIKYGIASRLRKKKFPYRVIQNGDVVIQVGAPKDTLLAGRSRAMNFLQLVGKGKVLVIEPDQTNCDALRSFSKRYVLTDRLIVCQMGAWSVAGELQFLSNPDHPATNILKVVQRAEGDAQPEAGYNSVTVSVDTLDNILAASELPKPRLISITANGAEPEILRGLAKTLTMNIPYISLAATGPGYIQLMSELNYDLVAYDDRGYTFCRREV
jgi:FkbM family methyltransferase